MEKKTDLRVIKTKRMIKNVFLEMLKKKPVDKITVTEIASLSEINKGTFYLHYSDIYELYNEVLRELVESTAGTINFYDDFFLNPELFVEKFINHTFTQMPFHEYPYLSLQHSKVMLPLLITDSIKDKIYKSGHIPTSVENDIKLESIICSMAFLSRRYYNEHTDLVIRVISQNIRNTFRI